MNIEDIEKLLIYGADGSIMAPDADTSQQDRDIYNAWRRKMYKLSKKKK